MEQNGRLFIIRQEERGRDRILSVFCEGKTAVELTCFGVGDKQLLGSIYIGKVKNIVKNIQAAFIEIGEGILCYYPMEQGEEPIYVKEKKGTKLAVGDELLVQVNREAVKTKAPTVTCNLNFPGKYLVLTTGKKQLGLSSKLSAEEKERLRELAESFFTEEFGVIIRTNAAQAEAETLKEEFARLHQTAQEVLNTGIHKRCFSRIYQEPPAYAAGIRNLKKEQLLEIVTDDAQIYEAVKNYLSVYQPEDLEKLRFYAESAPSLDSLYGLSRALEHALMERVWLRSGAYLVIQPTEALTVIDVNTGKYDGHKKPGETFLHINLEAAREIARQIRLRNLSGIIVVDFIDLEEKESRQQLMSVLSKALKEDPVKTVLVDMTPLGLVEITRKKVRRTLKEQVAE